MTVFTDIEPHKSVTDDKCSQTLNLTGQSLMTVFTDIEPHRSVTDDKCSQTLNLTGQSLRHFSPSLPPSPHLDHLCAHISHGTVRHAMYLPDNCCTAQSVPYQATDNVPVWQHISTAVQLNLFTVYLSGPTPPLLYSSICSQCTCLDQHLHCCTAQSVHSVPVWQHISTAVQLNLFTVYLSGPTPPLLYSSMCSQCTCLVQHLHCCTAQCVHSVPVWSNTSTAVQLNLFTVYLSGPTPPLLYSSICSQCTCPVQHSSTAVQLNLFTVYLSGPTPPLLYSSICSQCTCLVQHLHCCTAQSVHSVPVWPTPPLLYSSICSVSGNRQCTCLDQHLHCCTAQCVHSVPVWSNTSTAVQLNLFTVYLSGPTPPLLYSSICSQCTCLVQHSSTAVQLNVFTVYLSGPTPPLLYSSICSQCTCQATHLHCCTAQSVQCTCQATHLHCCTAQSVQCTCQATHLHCCTAQSVHSVPVRQHTSTAVQLNLFTVYLSGNTPQLNLCSSWSLPAG